MISFDHFFRRFNGTQFVLSAVLRDLFSKEYASFDLDSLERLTDDQFAVVLGAFDFERSKSSLNLFFAIAHFAAKKLRRNQHNYHK